MQLTPMEGCVQPFTRRYHPVSVFSYLRNLQLWSQISVLLLQSSPSNHLRIMLPNIVNQLSYPNTAVTICAGLLIVLLGLRNLGGSPGSIISFTFVAYLWIWRLVAISLRGASRYCRLCWMGSYGAAFIL